MPSPLTFSMASDPALRTILEQQLAADLKYYGVTESRLSFEWSDPKFANDPNGGLETMSSIIVFDENLSVIADGELGFISEDNFFLAFWDLVDVYKDYKVVRSKKVSGIPDHVWNQIPEVFRQKHEKKRMHS